MIKKLLFILLLIPLFTACETDLTYNGQTKIIYEGRLTDADGQPLGNIPVSVYVSKNGAYVPFLLLVYGDRDLISYGTTDAEGYYKLVFPDPENEDYIALYINKTTPGKAAEALWSVSTIYNMRPENLQDYTLNFGDTALYHPENSVTLTINTESLSGLNLEKMNITGLVHNNESDYNLALPPVGNPYYYDNNNYEVSKNQTVMIQYRLSDNSVHEAEVAIAGNNITYNLDY